MPPKALEQIRRLFPEDEELEIAQRRQPPGLPVAVHRGVHAADRRAVPAVRSGHSRDNNRVAIADRTALTSALRRMSIIASDQTHRIRLSFNAGHAQVQRADARPRRSDGRVAVRYTGDPLDIGFNANYLLEILRYIPTEEVRLTFKAPERAATIEPEGWADPASYLCLVMPLRLLD